MEWGRLAEAHFQLEAFWYVDSILFKKKKKVKSFLWNPVELQKADGQSCLDHFQVTERAQAVW